MDTVADNTNRFNKILANINSKYRVVVCYHLNDEKEILLFDNESPKRCRFCGRSYPEVTFKKVAHAISHMVENRHLKSDYECDVCNGEFAVYETDYSAFMNLYHTMFHIHGKGGIPKFKNGSSNFSNIEVDKSETLRINVKEGEESLIIWEEEDKAKNTIKVVGNRTYTPQNVLKAIIKMALTIAPKDEMPYLRHTIDWLKNRPCSGGIAPVIMRFYRSSLPFTSCFLLQKKSNVTEPCPQYLFALAYKNIVIQTAVPFVEADGQYKNQKITYPYFPTSLDVDQKPFLVKTENFAGTDKIRGERVDLALHYDRVDVSIPDTNNS